jgi:uncharacterized protein
MKVLIFGGTGFIGSDLVPALLREGFEILLFTRRQWIESADPKLHYITWDAVSNNALMDYLQGDYSIINLAGESIGTKPWTARQKNKILMSRIGVAEAISVAVDNARSKPGVIIQASAVGFYGSQSEVIIYEQARKGEGFLAEVVNSWEQSLKLKSSLQTRIIYIRTGMVLDNDGGALSKFQAPFRFHLGGHLGTGKQWLSWIHISDVVNAIIFLLKNRTTEGIYNLTSPQPIRMKEFACNIARTTATYSWIHIPAPVLRLIMSERADELILTSQKVLPVRLLDAGYSFHFGNIGEALNDLIKKKKKK